MIDRAATIERVAALTAEAAGAGARLVVFPETACGRSAKRFDPVGTTTGPTCSG